SCPEAEGEPTPRFPRIGPLTSYHRPPLSHRFSQVLNPSAASQQSSVLLFLVTFVVMPPTAAAGEGELHARAVLRGDRHGRFPVAEKLDSQVLSVTGICDVPAATQHHRDRKSVV